MMQFIAQVFSLLAFIAYSALVGVLYLPWFLIHNLAISLQGLLSSSSASDRQVKRQPQDGTVAFYEGYVSHIRRKPKVNTFKYYVRTCCLDLDAPPSWFRAQARDHMTAQEARAYAGTDGPVKLLTNPVSAGYVINPISVYYCYSKAGALDKCIAEVTNTPWNERVTFVFSPTSEASIKKALHVSPLMDMQGTWRLEASEPGRSLKLIVRVSHPDYGDFFYADLMAKRCEGRHAGHRNEEAGLGTLFKYGYQPHRIAVWIYWQAVVLLWKGVPLYSPPPFATLHSAKDGAAHPRNKVSSCPFTWRPAPAWPWDTWGLTPQHFSTVNQSAS